MIPKLNRAKEKPRQSFFKVELETLTCSVYFSGLRDSDFSFCFRGNFKIFLTSHLKLHRQFLKRARQWCINSKSHQIVSANERDVEEARWKKPQQLWCERSKRLWVITLTVRCEGSVKCDAPASHFASYDVTSNTWEKRLHREQCCNVVY